MHRTLRRLFTLAAMATALSVAASPAQAAVTEFALPTKSVGGLSQGPDGTVFYASVVGEREHFEGRVGRVGPAGPLGETGVPVLPGEGIAVGTEGAVWLAPGCQEIGRLTPDGEYLKTTAGTSCGETAVAPAAGGGVWYVERDDMRGDVVGRVSASGQVSEFAIPNRENGPQEVVEGHEGDAWFTEYFADKVVRVTSAGQFTEFSLPSGSRPRGITVDAEGNIWFGEAGRDAVGRITPAGTIAEFPLPGVTAGLLAAGADGRIWFTQSPGQGTLGRVGPSGRYSKVTLPNHESEPADVIAGAEGNIWYTAMGEHGCEGGGSCMIWAPHNPAIVGRIESAPLKVTTDGRARLHRNRADVRVTCSGGVATDTCQGSIEIRLRGRAIARSRYSVPVDGTARVTLRRLPKISSLLAVSKKATQALAVFHHTEGIGKDFRVQLEGGA